MGQPLFEVSTPPWSSPAGPTELARLSRAIDLTESRTMYQDVGFALRQLVDIAERALSPAVNDPTTAVQALDRIGDLVRRIAARPAPDGLTTGEGGGAGPGPPPGARAGTSVVELAFEEIRWFGRESIQISRRLLAIFDDLEQLVADTGRPERAEAVRPPARPARRRRARDLPRRAAGDGAAARPHGPRFLTRRRDPGPRLRVDRGPRTRLTGPELELVLISGWLPRPPVDAGGPHVHRLHTRARASCGASCGPTTTSC